MRPRVPDASASLGQLLNGALRHGKRGRLPSLPKPSTPNKFFHFFAVSRGLTGVPLPKKITYTPNDHEVIPPQLR